MQASTVTLTPKPNTPKPDDTPTLSLTLTPLTPTPMPHDTPLDTARDVAARQARKQ